MADRADSSLRIGKHVEAALAAGRGVVALETTLIAHGLPAPDNIDVARQLEEVVDEAGATPATIAILDGVPTIGLSPNEIESLALAGAVVAKLSSRDLGTAVARGIDGATTVAATITLAALAGIEVMATGGLGGVHRGAAQSFDESGDLFALHETPVLVVASGVKSILDIGATLERLETLEVPVVGFGTDQFPGFYLHSSEHHLDWRVDSVEEVVDAFLAHRSLGKGAMLLANPAPEKDQLPPAMHDAALAEALSMAQRDGVQGKEVTPFLLARFAEITGGESVRVTKMLGTNNAFLAGQIAVELAARRRGGV